MASITWKVNDHVKFLHDHWAVDAGQLKSGTILPIVRLDKQGGWTAPVENFQAGIAVSNRNWLDSELVKVDAKNLRTFYCYPHNEEVRKYPNRFSVMGWFKVRACTLEEAKVLAGVRGWR